MCLKKIISLLLFVLSVTAVPAQDANTNTLDSFSAKFITAIRANEKQRVYLVTDKSVFIAGEYIWFRAFLFNAASQKLSAKNKFLFVDVVNDNDSVIKHMILDAANRQLNSRIQFPDSLPTGYYWLRAYTRFMAEHDTNNVCIKPLYVVGKEGNNIAPPKKALGNKDELPIINFYPEGNNIITGINSTIALQASYKNGDPLGIEGVIKDTRDTIVAKFTTNQYGLTKFDFEPSGYRKYKVVINWLGKEISYPLPAFNFFKGQLSALKQTGGYKLRVLLGDSIYTKDALSYVVGISKDSLIFAGIGKGQYEINIDDHKLPQGIATFYLFDKNFRLLSERSVYVNSNSLQVKIAADKGNYSKHDKITMDLSVTDAEKNAIPSSIAVSVSDSVLSQTYNNCNLADIKYDLQDIDNLFLTTNNCFSDDDIDLFMLAKNNSYQTLNKATDQSINAADDSLLFIGGKVLNNKKEPSANKIVTLISNTGSNGVFAIDTTDYAGHFYFPISTYPDSTQFAIEIKDMNNHVLNNEVVLDNISFPKLKTPLSSKKYLTTTARPFKERLNVYNNFMPADMGGHHLPPVTVQDNTKLVDYDISKRVSSYSSILTAKDLDGRTSLDLVILRVSGLQLLNGYLVIHGLNTFASPGPDSEPLLLVEGVQVSLATGVGTVSPIMSYLKSLDPKTIDFVEILKGPDAANYGVRGGNGVILINLLHEYRSINSSTNNMKIFYPQGISNPALFPNYNYDVKDKKNTIVSDDRSTLFWNGNFLTGTTANSTFTVFTSDVPSTYNITVTGFTARGDIINKTITVRSK